MAMMPEEWRFLFDLHGVLEVPNALSVAHVAALNALLDEHIARDTDPSSWSTLRFPLSDRAPSAQADNPETLLDWGKPVRDCLALPSVVGLCDAIVDDRFRLDHMYLDVIKPPTLEQRDQHGNHQTPGPIANGLHGSSGGFNPSQYYHFRGGRMFNGLCVVAFNLTDVNAGTDGGFACVPGTHKSNYSFPNGWRNMQLGVHPLVKRIGGQAGSAIIFTEALTHGTLPWTGRGERRTLFMKISPHPLSWSTGYFSLEGRSWASELTDKQRLILEPPSVPGSPAAQSILQAQRRRRQPQAKL
jgi:hypothetical protein